jgi:bacterioferritin-associated ferredoxin
MCHAISENVIRNFISKGANTIEKVSERSLAGTGCGGCLTNVESLVEAGVENTRVLAPCLR